MAEQSVPLNAELAKVKKRIVMGLTLVGGSIFLFVGAPLLAGELWDSFESPVLCDILGSRNLGVTVAVAGWLSGFVLGGMGLRLWVLGKGRSPRWALAGLLPLVGPVLVIGTIATGEFLARFLARFLASGILRGTIAWTVSFGMAICSLTVAFLMFAHVQEMQYHRRSVQSEARTNLGGLYVAENAFYGEHERYGTFEEIGFTVPEPRRYTYRIDVSGKPGTIIPASNGQVTPDNTVVSAGISFDSQHFTATATANLDCDATIDQWHVNDAKQGLQQADVNDMTD